MEFYGGILGSEIETRRHYPNIVVLKFAAFRDPFGNVHEFLERRV